MAFAPFAPEEVVRLLKSDASRPTLLKTRESKTLELKANFNLSDDAKVDYARTMAAFSDREGGYLMFGIRNRPHEKDGMQKKKLDDFDPRVLSQFLQNHFSPNIDWEHLVHEVDSRRFGFIYVWPAKRMPVVCIAPEMFLKDRRDQRLSQEAMRHLEHELEVQDECAQLAVDFDEVIEAHGGWPGAFQSNPEEPQ